jgi:hypothetical protein
MLKDLTLKRATQHVKPSFASSGRRTTEQSLFLATLSSMFLAGQHQEELANNKVFANVSFMASALGWFGLVSSVCIIKD